MLKPEQLFSTEAKNPHEKCKLLYLYWWLCHPNFLRLILFQSNPYLNTNRKTKHNQAKSQKKLDYNLAGQELYEEQQVYPQDFWIILLGSKSSSKKLPFNHWIFNSPLYYILPFPLFPTQINFLFCFVFYFPASPILHTMNFYHNIGWGAPHLLKCHQ